MERLSVSEFSGRVTFITGPGRGSGKTSLLNAALALLRGAGERPAFLATGFEGAAKAAPEGALSEPSARTAAPRMRVKPGEAFVGAEAWLGRASVRPEILAELPGSGALGRLALARAGREGEVVLAGPESNEAVALAVALCREAQGGGAVLVDGALDRITQVSGFAGARFFAAVRIDRPGLGPAVRRMRDLARRASLPRWEGADRDPAPIEVAGPLTEALVAGLPPDDRPLLIGDFTKIFIEEGRLTSLARRHPLFVRERIEFAGFVPLLHGLDEEEFLAALGTDFPAGLLYANPYAERLHDAA